jgi:hypothetical protein
MATGDPTDIQLGVDAAPVVTAALNLGDEALKVGLTIEQYKNTPAYLAALAAYQEQLARDTDEQVAIKAATGDTEAVAELQRRSS